MVDTGWHPPAATDPRTPVAEGRRRRRRAQRPRPATVRRPRHVHRRGRAVHRPRDPGLRRGLRDRRRRRRRDPRVRPRRAARGGARRHDPQVINLSAGCRTRHDLPSIAFEDVPPQAPRGPGLRARRRCRQRLVGGSLLAGGVRWAVGVGIARPRRPRVGVLQLRGLRRRLRARPQPRQRLPRRHLRVPRDARQGRRPGLRHRHGAVERHVVLGAGRGRPDRPRDQRDGCVGTRRTRRRAGPRAVTTPTRRSGPHLELGQPYPGP